MNWTIIISIIALLLGLTAIIMSIMWHGVKGPIGAQGRTGKDVSGELNRAVTGLDALKTTVDSHNIKLTGSIKANKNTIDNNNDTLNKKIDKKEDKISSQAFQTKITTDLRNKINCLAKAQAPWKFAYKDRPDVNPKTYDGDSSCQNWCSNYWSNVSWLKKDKYCPNLCKIAEEAHIQTEKCNL